MITGLCGVPATAIENPEKLTLSIFPDPASDLINITGMQVNKNLCIKIANLQGGVLAELHHINNTSATISISQLPQGLYILKLSIDNTPVAYKKISIVH